ncbi:unnamed protein product [Closterium sp. NIES-64]|nr:unnamed protein product [Closterium sp. NIES-64]
MVPGDAVIGNLPGGTMDTYYLENPMLDQVLPTKKFSIGSAAALSTNADNSLIMKFSRSVKDGNVKVLRKGVNYMIWAYSGSSQTLAQHPMSNIHVLHEDEKSYILHWAVNKDSTVSVAAQVATTGYIGIGFSKDGQMINSDAAIGNVPPGTLANGASVGPYYMSGRDVGSVQQTDTWKVTDTSVTTANGYTIIKFTRSMGTGHVPINPHGPTTIIWAYSPDGSTTLAFHSSNYGSASIDFIKGTTTAGEGSSTAAYIAHGALLSITFALLMPLAILLARLLLADRPDSTLLKSHPCYRPLGFQLHRGIQLFALAVALSGTVVIFVVSGSKGLNWTHGKVGLAAVILALAQAVVGLMRPDKTAPNRFKWLVVHCLVGATTIGLAWAAMFLGIDLYHTKFMQNVTWCYWVCGACVGMFGVAYLILVIPDSILSLKAPKGRSDAGKGTPVAF